MRHTAEDYIEKMKMLTFKELQNESDHCFEKLDAAIKLQDEKLILYYSKALKYLLLFRVVEERLDIPKREEANFLQYGKSEDS